MGGWKWVDHDDIAPHSKATAVRDIDGESKGYALAWWDGDDGVKMESSPKNSHCSIDFSFLLAMLFHALDKLTLFLKLAE